MSEKEAREFFTDKCGREVRRGDFIAYGHNLGRCAGIRFGIVLDIKAGQSMYRPELTEWSIRVMGVDDDWSFREAKLCGRCGNLQYPDRIVLMADALPDDYREMLREYYDKQV